MLGLVGLSWVADLRASSSHLARRGWFLSQCRGESVDASGRPLPWISYPAIAFLERRLPPAAELRIFEYGCGAGTLWWAARSWEVFVCEHDIDWHHRISRVAPAHVTIQLVPLTYDGDYCRCAETAGGSFDIIVVDGRDRVNCLRRAPAALSARGVVILDNSERLQYREGVEFLATQGFRSLPFVGLAPGVAEEGETSIFYRGGNCLGL